MQARSAVDHKVLLTEAMNLMNQIVRLLVSIGISLLVYVIYWLIDSRRHDVRLTWWARTRAESQLRVGRDGVGRLFAGWLLAMTIFAFAIEKAGTPFTYYWLEECLLNGDWIGMLIVAAVLTFAEWHRGCGRLATRGSAET